MESKNEGLATDDQVMHNHPQVYSMISKVDHIPTTGVYKPNIWKYDGIEALTIKYVHEKYERMVSKLIEDVRCLFSNTLDIWENLELVDNMEKLGLAYLFEYEIKKFLDKLECKNNQNLDGNKNLYNTALLFTLLRKHGYHVSQDLFVALVDISTHSDAKSQLKLFEASHLAFEGEDILEKANMNSRKFLESIGSCLDIDASLAIISRTLKDPYNIWYNVKTQIDYYEKNKKSNSHLLNLAKYNFNMFQATHQKEVKELLRWWRVLDLEKSLPFIRNRIMESFVCAVGIVCEPKYGSLRNWLTKSITLVLVLDDVYDASGGTLEDLEIFTSAVYRWDDEETKTLPECMKTCLRTLYDTIKDIASEIEDQYGWNLVSPHLQKAWITFCQSLLKEARWFNKKYTPTIGEHTDNGVNSSSGPLLSIHIFFALVPNTEQQEVVDILNSTAEHDQNVGLIFRLCNDLGNYAVEIERSDASSSIQCIMHEQGVSEEVARIRIKSMIANAWKKINYERIKHPPLLQPYLKYSANIARVAHVVYHNGDGVSNADGMTRNHVMDLLSEPLLLT
ncbi:alpha-farnesene synthase-like [Heracleum sosnowskyi]|uniref:Alpha-farnesene synthase-like n=1 Tax=Heracleum sosnowskyi TaxID=360622 RepID=A0AAD8I768_9APIA|nr:alpha-farnesene synthase-like [Heracleum sosnowskyi]